MEIAARGFISIVNGQPWPEKMRSICTTDAGATLPRPKSDKMACTGHHLSLLGRGEAAGVVVFRLLRRCYCVLSQRPSRYPYQGRRFLLRSQLNGEASAALRAAGTAAPPTLREVPASAA